MSNFVSKSFYLEPTKIIRDLVHGYINLTRFELQLIDTIEFQRLKDVRQLTCQQVYPSARHTRFEHSLGVLELTKQAIKYLNKNGMLDKQIEGGEKIIDEQLAFNTCLAALLHDVGHCPFSHLGEIEINKSEVRTRLKETMESHSELAIWNDLIEKLDKTDNNKMGSVHEQISCIVIIEKFSNILSKLNQQPVDIDDKIQLSVDYELIVRCILGCEYNTSTSDLFEKYKKHNIMIRLINSSIFDMDKLDYIMRDSFFTGIGTPTIDTKRLFRNMYLGQDYSLVFTSKAVPALQNMIDSRDELYMYVYNHHAVVFSDFMNSYILRKLAHNSYDFCELLNLLHSNKKTKSSFEEFPISTLGLIPKNYLFSISSIVDQNRSDSDWISILNIIRYNAMPYDIIKLRLNGEIDNYITKKQKSELSSQINNAFLQKSDSLTQKIFSTYNLIERYQTRNFLKPWWKTVFEFTNFMKINFGDDKMRAKIGKSICNDNKAEETAEFRSQIAKHVIFITQKLFTDKLGDLQESFNEGDFFIVQRSNRFFALEAIEKLDIALKTSEIVGSPNDIKYQTADYYIKFLTNIIPQKDYSAIYAKEGFYVFSKPIFISDCMKKKKHYEEIERIFIFTVTEFVRKGPHWFNDQFGNNCLEKENLSMEELYTSYKKKYFYSEENKNEI